MKKILVFGMTENPGGVEAFLMNYYRHMDKQAIQFDFLCNTYHKVAYEDELVAGGSTMYHIVARSQNRAQYKKELEDIFKNYAHQYDAIWVNVSSLANIDYLKMAKKYGIKKRIIHAHNSMNMDSFLRGLLHKINRLFIHKYATDFLSCSQDSSVFFYPKSCFNQSIVINNAIDISKVSFNVAKRQMIRQQLNWQDAYILGNIGRLHFQKNQLFLIDIFKAIHDVDKQFKLVLVGQGEDELVLKEKVKSLGISDAVYFAGVQHDIQAWLSAFDLFLFPSKFEGLSIAGIEAQANGLPVVLSDKVIPQEINMTDNMTFIDLNNGFNYWADYILANKNRFKRLDATTIEEQFNAKRFNIHHEVKQLEDIL